MVGDDLEYESLDRAARRIVVVPPPVQIQHQLLFQILQLPGLEQRSVDQSSGVIADGFFGLGVNAIVSVS